MTTRSTSAFRGYRFPDDVIALAVRWYLRYRLSYADVAEWLTERGLTVDPSTIYDWVRVFTSRFIAAARAYRTQVGKRWWVDETYLKIGGRWRYLYRAIDEHGQIVDVYLSDRRNTAGTPPSRVRRECRQPDAGPQLRQIAPTPLENRCPRCAPVAALCHRAPATDVDATTRRLGSVASRWAI